LTAITTLWHWRNNALLHFELKSARFLDLSSLLKRLLSAAGKDTKPDGGHRPYRESTPQPAASGETGLFDALKTHYH